MASGAADPSVDGLPPGLHMQAEITVMIAGRVSTRQLRLLGDDARGYLLAGLPAVAPPFALGEIWFETLAEAFAEAEAVGVSPDAWAEITRVDQVPLPRRR
jgi:hypothetical protein